jgi:GAF domain-containing protein
MRRRTTGTEKIFDSLTALLSFSNAINSTLDIKEVENSILERTARLMETPNVAFFLQDKENKYLNLHKIYGFETLGIKLKSVQIVKESYLNVVQPDTVVTMEKVLTADELRLQRQQWPFLSDMVFTPLEAKGETFGLLGISQLSKNFSSFELEVFRSLGNQAAAAWKNAHSHKELQEALLHTTEALAETRNQHAL